MVKINKYHQPDLSISCNRLTTIAMPGIITAHGNRNDINAGSPNNPSKNLHQEPPISKIKCQPCARQRAKSWAASYRSLNLPLVRHRSFLEVAKLNPPRQLRFYRLPQTFRSSTANFLWVVGACTHLFGIFFWSIPFEFTTTNNRCCNDFIDT